MRYRLHSLELLTCLRLPFSGKQPKWLVSGVHKIISSVTSFLLKQTLWRNRGGNMLNARIFSSSWAHTDVEYSYTQLNINDQKQISTSERKNDECKDILLQLSAHWWTGEIVGFRSRCRKALNWCTLHTNNTAHCTMLNTLHRTLCTAQHCTLHTAQPCTLDNTAHFTVCVQSFTLVGGRVQFYASPSLHPSIFPLMQVLSATALPSFSLKMWLVWNRWEI